MAARRRKPARISCWRVMLTQRAAMRARVVSLDRTLGAMWLAGRATRKRRSMRLRESMRRSRPGAPVKTSAGLLTQLTPVDPLDASRAPFGFLRADEEEIVLALEARALHALGANAEPYFEHRLAQMDKVASAAAWALPEWLRANEELMLVEHERGKDDAPVYALAGVGAHPASTKRTRSARSVDRAHCCASCNALGSCAGHRLSSAQALQRSSTGCTNSKR